MDRPASSLMGDVDRDMTGEVLACEDTMGSAISCTRPKMSYLNNESALRNFFTLTL